MAQQRDAADAAGRTLVDAQIKQADAQIRSADTAIADGKLIQSGGNYSSAGLTADERMAIGFALDPLSPALARSAGKVLVLIDQPYATISTPAGAITVYRVEGLENARLLIDEKGMVAILGTQMLYLNFGDRARALSYFKIKNEKGLADPALKTFEVSENYFESLKKSAVGNDDSALYPNAPHIVDPTKAANQFGLRKHYFDELIKM